MSKNKSIRRHYSSPRFGLGIHTTADDGERRTSVNGNIANLTRSLSSLRLTPSRSSGEGWDIFGVVIDKEILETILSEHYCDSSLKIVKLTISKTTEKKRKDIKETYELSVRMKRIFGKSKLELLLKVFEEEHSRECYVYEYVIEKLIIYLREKYDVSNSCRYLPIPEYYRVLSSSEQTDKCKMMISRNPSSSQFHLADFTSDHKDGLDFNHCVSSLTSLARFHAISYCYRKEKDIDMLEKFPRLKCGKALNFLTSSPVLSSFINKLRQSPAFCVFITQENLTPDLWKNLEKFGVLCLGNSSPSLTFQYKDEDITKRSPTDASFQNLSHAYLGSCILDSLSLVLTTASSDVRSAHIVNLLHNVYFDAFSNAVSHVNAEVGVFSKDQFIRELKRLAVYSAVSVLSEKLNFCQKVTEDYVISLFKDVMKLCETLI